MSEILLMAASRAVKNVVLWLVWFPMGLLFLIYLIYIVVSIILELRK